jgi:hypothetical protein
MIRRTNAQMITSKTRKFITSTSRYSGWYRMFGNRRSETPGITPLTMMSAVATVITRKPTKMIMWCLLERCCGPSSFVFFWRKK